MKSRYQFEPGGKARILRTDHPAVREGHTLMRSRVFSARHLDRILIGGEMNAKIGGLWEKGWPGTRIFTLSLEERATCPRACPQWRSCYGNHQRFTVRVRKLAAWATVRDRKIDRVGDELPERCGSWSEESYHLVAKFLASFESKRVREFDANDMRYVAAVVRRLNGDER